MPLTQEFSEGKAKCTPVTIPTRRMKPRKMDSVILSVVLGPAFDPCCHFLGPRKLRQGCMFGWGWELKGVGNFFFFFISKHHDLLETEIKKYTHSWLVALVLPLVPGNTNPSIKLPRWTVLKRDTAV